VPRAFVFPASMAAALKLGRLCWSSESGEVAGLDPSRARAAAFGGACEPAVAVQHRPADRRRQSPCGPERQGAAARSRLGA
jgi:hypothetical protein